MYLFYLFYFILDGTTKRLTFVRSPNILRCVDKKLNILNAFDTNFDVNIVFEALKNKVLSMFSIYDTSTQTTLQELEDAFVSMNINVETLPSVYNDYHSDDEVDLGPGSGKKRKFIPGSVSSYKNKKSGKKKKAAAYSESKASRKTRNDSKDREEMERQRNVDDNHLLSQGVNIDPIAESKAESRAVERPKTEKKQAKDKKQQVKEEANIDPIADSKANRRVLESAAKKQDKDKKRQEKDEAKQQKLVNNLIRDAVKAKEQELKESQKQIEKQEQELKRQKEKQFSDSFEIARLTDKLVKLQEKSQPTAKATDTVRLIYQFVISFYSIILSHCNNYYFRRK